MRDTQSENFAFTTIHTNNIYINNNNGRVMPATKRMCLMDYSSIVETKL